MLDPLKGKNLEPFALLPAPRAYERYVDAVSSSAGKAIMECCNVLSKANGLVQADQSGEDTVMDYPQFAKFYNGLSAQERARLITGMEILAQAPPLQASSSFEDLTGPKADGIFRRKP